MMFERADDEALTEAVGEVVHHPCALREHLTTGHDGVDRRRRRLRRQRGRDARRVAQHQLRQRQRWRVLHRLPAGERLVAGILWVDLVGVTDEEAVVGGGHLRGDVPAQVAATLAGDSGGGRVRRRGLVGPGQRLLVPRLGDRHGVEHPALGAALVVQPQRRRLQRAALDGSRQVEAEQGARGVARQLVGGDRELGLERPCSRRG